MQRAAASPGSPGERRALPGPPSFRELAAEHADLVASIAAVAGVPADRIDDVTQTVLLVLWHHLLRRGELEHVKPWLRTVTRRVAWAQNRLEKARSDLPDGYVVAEEDCQAPSAEHILESLHAIRLVREITEKLKPRRREVFVRHELDGEPVTEIAAALGISVNTGYTRLRLAREDFQRLLRARLRRDERRKALFLPFLGEQREALRGVDLRGTAARALLCALLALLSLDTRWPPVRSSQPSPARPPALASAPDLPETGSPGSPEPSGTGTPGSPAVPGELRLASDLPETGSPGSPEPSGTGTPGSPGAAPRPSPGGPPAVPVGRGAPRDAGYRTAPASSAPRRRRNIETARILLDTAERMAAEGQVDAAREALRSYAFHAPDDPLPATRAAIVIPSVPVAGGSASAPSVPVAAPTVRVPSVPVPGAGAPKRGASITSAAPPAAPVPRSPAR